MGSTISNDDARAPIGEKAGPREGRSQASPRVVRSAHLVAPWKTETGRVSVSRHDRPRDLSPLPVRSNRYRSVNDLVTTVDRHHRLHTPAPRVDAHRR